VAKRDQAMSAFRRHDAGKARRAEHVTFQRIALEYAIERFFRHYDPAFGDGLALGGAFSGNVDHVCLTALV
jgi:hypothetical protein